MTAATPRTSLRIDWVLALLSVWLIGGFYIDLWAHAHGQVDNTFFTPWHALLYTGAASFGVVLGAVAIFGTPRQVSVRDALPGPYAIAILGAVLFAIGGVVDLGWHTLFGFEVDTEALLSPTHLALATSGLLMVGGPMRSGAARLLDAGRRRPSWRLAGPFVVPLAMASAIFIAFTQYANPLVDVWSSAIGGEASEPTAQLYAMAPDGSGQRRLAVVDGDARGPRLSPDGRSIVYSVSSGDAGAIHVMNVDGTGDRQLTTEGSTFGPAWSPDGAKIAFSSVHEGEPDIWVMNADGTDIRRLTDDPASDWAVAWAPDGASISFNSDRAGTFDLFRMDADGGHLVQLTTGPSDDHDPAYSPDGFVIAFSSNRSGEFQVWLTSSTGGEPNVLATGDGSAYMPTWSPDGSKIAFTSNRTGDYEVFVVAAAGGDPQNISRNPGADDGWVSPAWSPDGATILYPSQGAIRFWRAPFIRQGFGAAGLIIAAAILAGTVLFARRRVLLPFGAYTLLVAVPAAMATVLSDEYRFIPGVIAAGFLSDLVARAWPAGRSRLGDGIVAFLVPASFFAFYFATIALSGGIGWSIHLWLGAIALAGVIGLFLDELGRGPARASG